MGEKQMQIDFNDLYERLLDETKSLTRRAVVAEQLVGQLSRQNEELAARVAELESRQPTLDVTP